MLHQQNINVVDNDLSDEEDNGLQGFGITMAAPRSQP